MKASVIAAILLTVFMATMALDESDLNANTQVETDHADTEVYGG